MKTKVLHIGELDYINANRRAARLEEIKAHGKPVMFRPLVIKSKKTYDRNREKRDIKIADD